jgi:hypothetical protein
MSIDVITEQDTIDILGEERFERLVRERWLSPFYKVEGYEGQPMYRLDLVHLRLKEDLRKARTVTKGYGGSLLLEPSNSVGGHRVDTRFGTDSTSTPRLYICLFCGGTGQCPDCRGTGRMPLQDGSRECPQCQGMQVCPKCHGEGKVDVRPERQPAPPALARQAEQIENLARQVFGRSVGSSALGVRS